MKTITAALMVLLSQNIAHAEEIDFHSLWNKIRENSHGLARETHELNASQSAVSRAEKHWLPSLMLSGQAYSTNDPGNNFFSTLSQRQITAADFSPSSLNQPGQHVFERLSLGLDLPVYEGGRKISERQALEKIEESQLAKKEGFLLDEYIETAKSYSGLNTVKIAREHVNELLEKVTALMSRYSIGNHSNLVGYSGMLGLRSLKNRLEGAALELQYKQEEIQTALAVKAKLESTEWHVKNEDLYTFLDRELPAPKKDITAVSYQEKMVLSKSEALDRMKDAEKARFLPKVGLFADESLTHGARDTAKSFEAGVYLKWALFNPDNLGHVGQADELRLAATADSANAQQMGFIARKNLVQSEDVLKKNHALLIESEKLLSEQAMVASKLFQSGSISALQLAEVLNRRLDMILNLKEVEQNLINVRAKRVSLSQSEGVSL